MTDENHLKQARYHWRQFRQRPIWAQVAVLLPIIIVVVGGLYGLVMLTDQGTASPTPDFDAHCQEQIGESWEFAGYADFPGADHYDVQCLKQSPGLFSDDETTWITVPKNTTESGNLSLSGLPTDETYKTNKEEA